MVEVLVLNLLDSLPDKESIIEQYRTNLEAKVLDYRSDSVAKLAAIIEKHSLLVNTAVPINAISDGQLSKRKSIGYSCIRNLKKGRNGVNTYDCLHPAFINNPLLVKCGDLIPISMVKK